MKNKNLVVGILCLCSTASLEVVADDSLIFNGYARYGSHSILNSPDSEDEVGADYKYVETTGGLGSAAGRLGNETYGGEIQLTKTFESESGVDWSVGFMIEQYADYDLGIKKFYAEASNVFESQPNMSVWAGRVHNMRPQTHLSNYFIINTDGQGGGFKDMEFDAFDLDFSIVAKPTGGGSSDDDGLMAVTSQFKNFDVADLFTIDLIANYGFDTAETTTDTHINAYQFGALVNYGGDDWKHKITVRQSDNTINELFRKAEGVSAFAAYLEGTHVFNDTFTVLYEVGYDAIDNNGDNDTDRFVSRDTAHMIIRPMIFWNANHSTWFETGYDFVDYHDAGEDKAWKVTISQNISFDAFAKARPMLRAFVTYGVVENDIETDKRDVLTAGLMFESWW